MRGTHEQTLISLGVPSSHATMQKMLERLSREKTWPFTALVCHNDMVAMGAIRALQESGLRVPEDASVIGFDVAAQYALAPGLTSIRFSRQEMGRRAVQLLTEERSHVGAHPAHRETFPVELVERETTRRCTVAQSKWNSMIQF